MVINELLTQVLTPLALTLLRVVCGYLVLVHSTMKLFHKPHVAFFDSVKPFSLFWIAGVVEFVCSLLIILGLFTQAAAFILCGNMAFAYFIGHAPRGNFLFPMINEGEPAVLFCFIALLLAATGAGPWSLDALIW